MMAGNPSRWSLVPPSQQTSALLSSSSPSLFPSHQYVIGSSSSVLPFLNSLPDNQELPQSWSQLLLGGLSGEEEDSFGASHFQPKKLENWEDHILSNNNNNPYSSSRVPVVVADVKQEIPKNSSNLYGHHGDEEFQPPISPTWSQPLVMPVSSPRSCVTSSLSNNILDFSYNKPDARNQDHPDQSSECNSSAAIGGVCKKPRVQTSSSQPPLKVRKEKLGDRITNLHQLVSPFGKTDTASVLLEAIGYIRFLQGQIEALSSPYLGTSAASTMRNQQQRVQGERNCVFPEDPGQLLNDICLKRKGGPNQQDSQEKPKDLKSRGLCLIPVSCTQHVGSDNGADYWAPAIGGGF